MERTGENVPHTTIHSTSKTKDSQMSEIFILLVHIIRANVHIGKWNKGNHTGTRTNEKHIINLNVTLKAPPSKAFIRDTHAHRNVGEKYG